MLSKGNIFKQYAKAQLEADIKSESLNFSYDIKEKNGKNMQILIKVSDTENGLSKIKCDNGNII